MERSVKDNPREKIQLNNYINKPQPQVNNNQFSNYQSNPQSNMSPNNPSPSIKKIESKLNNDYSK